MQKKEKNIMPIIIICSLIFYFANRLSYIYSLIPITNIFLRVNLVIQNFSEYFIGPPSFKTTDLFVGIGAVIVLLVVMEIKSGGKKNFRKGIEHGSAEWGTKADQQPFLSKNKRNRVLLSETESIMINEEPADPKNQRNRNVLVIGGSGSGKTRYVVKPNLLQMNSSFVITDPKGDLVKETGKMFADNGFKIKIFNTIDLINSMKYNPFVYIKTESDVLKFVDYLMANTSDPKKTGGDEFWAAAEKLLYMAFIGLMLETCEEKELNFNTLIRMISLSQVDEEDSNHKNVIDQIFDEHAEDFPESFAVSQYLKFKLAAGKTAKSILIQVGARLAPFDIKEVREATSEDELDLKSIGDEKTVLYLMVSDTSPTFNFLVGLMYSQLFNVLIEHADRQPGNKLKVPIQCILDEFANIGKIPNFEKLIATIRSRGISVMVILQTLAQLKANYKDEADTIVGNCDSQVFLGGRESTTLKSLSESLGKETVDVAARNLSYGQNKSWSDSNSLTGRELMAASEIAVMDNSMSIVQIRGVKPFISKKMDLTRHPNYHMLSDHHADGKQFEVEDYITKYRTNRLNTNKETAKFVFKNKDGITENYEIDQNPDEYNTMLNLEDIQEDQIIHAA